MFVFENVPGLLTAKQGKYLKDMKEGFEKIGYHVECQILKSEDFEVLQNRRRVILIGWKNDLVNSSPVSGIILKTKDALWSVFCFDVNTPALYKVRRIF